MDIYLKYAVDLCQEMESIKFHAKQFFSNLKPLESYDILQGILNNKYPYL